MRLCGIVVLFFFPAWEAIRSHTEHGHVLLAVQVPVAPVGPVAVQRGVLLVVVGGLGAEGVDHADVAPRDDTNKLS